jgi:hypothetical protein
MTYQKRIIVPCDCDTPAHVLMIEVEPNPVRPELRFWPKLNRNLPFWKRVGNALAYVASVDLGWCDFDDLQVTDAAVVEKIRDACETFLMAWKNKATNEEREYRMRKAIHEVRAEEALVKQWSTKLAEYTGRPVEQIEKDGLTAYDFRDDIVALTFEDGSTVRFVNAFMLVGDEYVVVFTEHCGYHAYYRESVVRGSLTEQTADGRTRTQHM